MGKIRQQQVAERIQAELMHVLQVELRDPRLTMVTVTDVDIDRELQFADVFVSKIADASERRDILRALDGARGFLRRELAHRIRMKVVPELRFHWDPSLEQGERIAKLIDTLEETPTPTDQAESGD